MVKNGSPRRSEARDRFALQSQSRGVGPGEHLSPPRRCQRQPNATLNTTELTAGACSGLPSKALRSGSPCGHPAPALGRPVAGTDRARSRRRGAPVRPCGPRSHRGRDLRSPQDPSHDICLSCGDGRAPAATSTTFRLRRIPLRRGLCRSRPPYALRAGEASPPRARATGSSARRWRRRPAASP